jgi:hypothetical protein
MFGYGVTTYIVLPTTSGAASCFLRTPVSNVHAGLSDATLAAVISASPLYRELAKSLAGRIHCPSSAAVAVWRELRFRHQMRLLPHRRWRRAPRVDRAATC